MKRVAPLLFAVLTGLLAVSCSSDSGPALPQPAMLVFPDNLSECTTGVDLGGNSSRVTFLWEEAANTFDYELTIENLSDSSDRQVFVTEETLQEVVLSKATGYSWRVVSRNEAGTETADSEEWMFINAGSLDSYPPFPANQIAPAVGERLERPQGGQLSLQWSATDLDNDIVQIELYASTDQEPALEATLDPGTNQYPLDVRSGTRYFWKIRITDQAGNSSVSNTQDFFVE